MQLDVNNRKIEADPEGYLLNPADWNEEVTRLIAAYDGITLTDTHWGLVEYVRDYYKQNHCHPTMHTLVMTLGKQHGEGFSDRKAYEKFLYEMFPRGPVQTLCKLGGLPKPMGDVQD